MRHVSTAAKHQIDNTGRYLFIPVETKVRELDAKLFLALTAAEAGWVVILGGQKELRRRLPQFSSGVYIDKSVTVNKQKWFKYCKALGHVVVAWDEEGLVYFDEETLKEMRLGKESLSSIELFFAWGDHQKNSIRSMLPDLQNNLQVTGNPRFDLLRQELRGLYDQSTYKLRQTHGRFILINTSFPFANHFLGEEAMHTMYANYPINRLRPDFFREWAKVHAAALASFRQMIPEVSRAFPEHTIILRPHPSENHDNWRQWVCDVPRVKVLTTGPVVEWIAAADFMIHFDCTTGIEAFAMDVCAIAFDDGKIPGYRQPLPNALSYHARTIGKVVEMGKLIIDGKLGPASEDTEMKKIAHRHIASLDGEFAVDRIVQILRSIPEGSVSIGNIQMVRARFYAFYVWLRDGMQRKLKKKETSYAAQKFPQTDIAEIQGRANKLSAVLGRFDNVSIIEKGKNCFEIKVEQL